MIVANVSKGMVVYPKVVEAAVLAELPFMATEEILMAGVKAGGDRQDLHERIRKHSLAAAAQVKQHGQSNDLIARLQSDASFKQVNLGSVLDPSLYIGRAPQQVDEFIEETVTPIRERYAGILTRTSADLRV